MDGEPCLHQGLTDEHLAQATPAIDPWRGGLARSGQPADRRELRDDLRRASDLSNGRARRLGFATGAHGGARRLCGFVSRLGFRLCVGPHREAQGPGAARLRSVSVGEGRVGARVRRASRRRLPRRRAIGKVHPRPPARRAPFLDCVRGRSRPLLRRPQGARQVRRDPRTALRVLRSRAAGKLGVVVSRPLRRRSGSGVPRRGAVGPRCARAHHAAPSLGRYAQDRPGARPAVRTLHRQRRHLFPRILQLRVPSPEGRSRRLRG